MPGFSHCWWSPPLASADDAAPAPQKAVLVTGASTGIGRKITGRLAAEGCFVYAGVAIAGPIVQTTDEDFDYLMDVNVYGPYRVTRAFSPLLIEAFGDALAAEMAQSQAGR